MLLPALTTTFLAIFLALIVDRSAPVLTGTKDRAVLATSSPACWDAAPISADGTPIARSARMASFKPTTLIPDSAMIKLLRLL